MEFLYSITMYKCGVYNIPGKLHMITTFFTYYGTNLVFPVVIGPKIQCFCKIKPCDAVFAGKNSF